MKHRLTEKDKQALTATCSICGPGVKIRRNGKYGFACVVGKREALKRWALAHPEKARERRKHKPSPHRLKARDGGLDLCAICGAVNPVAWGRGWMCPNRARELNRRNTPASPTPKCPKCLTLFLNAKGECPECDDRMATDLGYALMVDGYNRRREAASLPWVFDGDDYETRLGHGFTIVDGETPLDDDYESVVPGWQTLGPPVDPSDKWYPKYVQLKQRRA